MKALVAQETFAGRELLDRALAKVGCNLIRGCRGYLKNGYPCEHQMVRWHDIYSRGDIDQVSEISPSREDSKKKPEWGLSYRCPFGIGCPQVLREDWQRRCVATRPLCIISITRCDFKSGARRGNFKASKEEMPKWSAVTCP